MWLLFKHLKGPVDLNVTVLSFSYDFCYSLDHKISFCKDLRYILHSRSKDATFRLFRVFVFAWNNSCAPCRKYDTLWKRFFPPAGIYGLIVIWYNLTQKLARGIRGVPPQKAVHAHGPVRARGWGMGVCWLFSPQLLQNCPPQDTLGAVIHLKYRTVTRFGRRFDVGGWIIILLYLYYATAQVTGSFLSPILR